MRLLQPIEREISFKKEKDFAQSQARELSSEITSLVKAFNKTKTELESNKSLLLKDYNEFWNEIDEKRRTLEEEVRILENRRDNAFVPLYEKEKQLGRTKRHLANLQEAIELRELNLKVREKDLKELKDAVDKIADGFALKEKELQRKEVRLSEKELKFVNFRANQERLFKRDKEKLRAWLEKEKNKIRGKI